MNTVKQKQNNCWITKYLRTGSINHLSRISFGIWRRPSKDIWYIFNWGSRGAAWSLRSALGWYFGCIAPMIPRFCFHSCRFCFKYPLYFKNVCQCFHDPYPMVPCPPKVCLSRRWLQTGRCLHFGSRWTLPNSTPFVSHSSCQPAPPQNLSVTQKMKSTVLKSTFLSARFNTDTPSQTRHHTWSGAARSTPDPSSYSPSPSMLQECFAG